MEPPGTGATRDQACDACPSKPPSKRYTPGIVCCELPQDHRDTCKNQEPSERSECLPSSSRLLNDLNRSRTRRNPPKWVSAMRTSRRFVGYVPVALRALDEGHGLLRSPALLGLILLAAEQNILHRFSRHEGDDGLRGGKHAPELRDLARQQAIHGASDAALQQVEARRVLELLL